MYKSIINVVFFTTFLSVFFNSNVPQSTLYDYRGISGTGTTTNPVSSKSNTNYVEYVVRKLADGNCWMSSDLKLTLSTSHSYEIATFAGGTATWTPNSTTDTEEFDYAITPATKTNTNGGYWYYNWYAATAGQGKRETIDATIGRSICPKGWRLPNSTNATDGKSFNKLLVTYNIPNSLVGYNMMQQAPLSYNDMGYYNNKATLVTSYSLFWSATPRGSISTTHALRLAISSNGNALASGSGSKRDTGAVRCLAI